jgi:glycerate 2-kinase
VNARAGADARRIFQAALNAADSAAVVERNLRIEDNHLVAGNSDVPLHSAARLVVVGAGKAGGRMAQAAERMLGTRISHGFISVKDGHVTRTQIISVESAGHPLPDARSLANGGSILLQVRDLAVDDIVLCLFSGGGSALMEVLGGGLTLEELRLTTRALMYAGADIVELNCVRKHISLVKGGQLARLAQPARVCTLLLSDVVGDDPSAIASGPTAPDPTTFTDAASILERFAVHNAEGVRPVYDYLRRCARKGAADTPKPRDPLFERVSNTIVGTNRMALEAAAREATALHYRPEILTSYLQGEASEIGKLLGGISRERRERGTRRRCLLMGGETTVTVRGSGRGGRNQELALSAALSLKGLEGVTLLSAATDGGDGSSDAAGALVDGQTIYRATERSLNARAALAANDSHSFFAALGDQIVTGPTLTNVNDIVVILFQ